MQIPASLQAELGIEDAAPACGGCIHACYRVDIGGERRFLKVNEARFADAFAAEADGLRALRAAGMAAPGPLAHGSAGGQAYLLLEFLELRESGDFAALGRMLASMHRSTATRFGWARDNYIGATPQRNAWCDEWSQFWLECPQPSLLHGDLWSANAGFAAGGPVVFDPAVYYGDREADLAMTELFGGFRAPSMLRIPGLAAGGRLRTTQTVVQPVSPAQPPEPLRRRLSRAGAGDATPFASRLGAFAARPTGTSRA